MKLIKTNPSTVVSWETLAGGRVALFGANGQLLACISQEEITFMKDIISLGKDSGSFSREVGSRGDF